MKNKFGLDRNIPTKIKKVIRNNCGFGCVVCGSGIYTYEHINPEFSEARAHDQANMTLLCGNCHLKVTKGILSKGSVASATEDPYCKKYGQTFDYFDVSRPFGLSLGRIYFYLNETGELLKINDRLVLGLKYPKDEPPQLSGVFLIHLETYYLKLKITNGLELHRLGT